MSPSEKNFDPLAHLCFSDVRVDSHSSPSYLQITIKTDPFRQIVTLFIGVSGGTLCPVSAVLNYMVARGSSPAPLFTWDDCRYLTREAFVARVRSALCSRLQREGLCGPQLPDRGDHNRLQMWDTDQNSGQVGECRIYNLHENSS